MLYEPEGKSYQLQEKIAPLLVRLRGWHLREEVQVSAQDLMNFQVLGGEITEAGLRNNISVALLYLESWLRGTGAVAIYNLMEDAATAEISRAQVWQWIHHPRALLSDGQKITPELYHTLIPEELEKIQSVIGEKRFASGKFALASQLFNALATEKNFTEFFTLRAYDYLE